MHKEEIEASIGLCTSWVHFTCSFLSFHRAFPLLISSILTKSRLKKICNRPRSIYQYSNMGPRLSGLTSIFGVVFFVSKSPVGIERQKKLEKFAILTRKPRSHA